MAVRFLPPPGEEGKPEPEDRGNLAEVISLRSRLSQRGWSETAPATGEGPAGEDPAVEPAGPAADVSGTRATGFSSGPVTSSDESSGPASTGASAAAPVVRLVSAPEPLSEAPAQDGQETEAEVETEAEIEVEAETETETGEPGGPERSASEDGVRLLARRARSSGELRGELLALGHDAAEVEETLEEFVRSLYLDDLGLARVLTEKLRDSKRASRAQIRRKLRERRLPDEAVETAIGELDDDEEGELLRRAAEGRARKLTGLDRQTAERRLLGFLSRRGWGGEPAMRATREALDAAQGGQGSRGGVRFR